MLIDIATAAQIDSWFLQGDRARMDGATSEDCPYRDDIQVLPKHVNDIARHWWTRGFAYRARLIRAMEAEKKIDELASDPGRG